MGEAVTESGAISAVAGFFRQNLDACAWAEDTTDATTHLAYRYSFFPTNLTTQPRSSSDSSSGSSSRGSSRSHGTSTGDAHDQPLLRIPLDRSCTDGPDEATVVHVSRGRTLLELVVSRGAGPSFSEHEVRVSHQAAVLLGQALARVRTWSALAETKLALEKSFQGMAEASTAVAVLVDEREKNTLRESELRAGVEEEHERALHTAGEELRRVSTEATGLQRRLVEVEESVGVLADAMSDCCRVATGAKDGGEGGGEKEEAEEGDGEEGRTEDVATGKLVVLIENAAQEALPCRVARVQRNDVAYPGPVTRVGEVGAFGIGARQESGSSAAGRYQEGGTRVNEPERKEDAASRVESLRIPVPHCDVAGPPPLTLSLRQDVTSSRVFTAGEKALASALAACLGTALFALREKRRRRTLAVALDADRKARSKHREEAVASVAAAATEAQERSDRAVAGMRALTASTQASKAQARKEAAAAQRAEKHANALRHLLAGLDREGGDHARVAKVVAARAADAVPACVDAVLLTPRRDSGRGMDVSGRFTDVGCGARSETATAGDDVPVLFSPDPRVWAASTAASAAASGGSRSGNPRRGCKRWAREVERAASQAVVTGKAVCVQDTTTAASGVTASSSRIVCFSPVPVFSSSFLNLPPDSAAGVSGQPGTPGRRTGSDTTRKKPWRLNPYDGSVCVVALALCIRKARGGDGSDDSDTSSPCSHSPASVSETRPADETRPTELPWISHAIDGVIHAVSLALSAAVTADDGFRNQQRPSRGGGVPAGLVESTGYSNRQGEGAENAHLSERKPRNRSSSEVKRLRDGTSSLAKRVQMLEERAAGLRASEARSSASLARARADAMGIRGELQLVALERDRLLGRLRDKDDRGEEGRGQGRKPLAPQPLRDNVRGPLLSRGDLEGAPYFANPPPFTDSSSSPPFYSMAARNNLGYQRIGGVSPPLGPTLRSTPALAKDFSRVGYGGAAQSEGHAAGHGKPNAVLSSVERGPPGDAPVNSNAATTMASSDALKRMASIHARLSDSLRHGISVSAVVQKG